MKFYIKGWFGNWKEVGEQEKNSYIEKLAEKSNCDKKTLVENHVRVSD